jgi:predicted flap endonuclease-1-like 5' DNA nuclease
MPQSYHLDPATIGLDRVKEEIRGRELSPKRRILGEALEERFSRLQKLGIDSLGSLIAACKNKKALTRTAEQSGLDEEYLVVLGREARGYLPQPIDLRRIPDTASEVTEALRSAGLGDSKKLWERIRETEVATDASGALPGGTPPAVISALAEKLHIPPEALRELSEMSDLARIPGVGPVFARMIHLAGYKTTAALAQADVEQLDQGLRQANAGNRYTSVMANQGDLENCIRWARELA